MILYFIFCLIFISKTPIAFSVLEDEDLDNIKIPTEWFDVDNMEGDLKNNKQATGWLDVDDMEESLKQPVKEERKILPPNEKIVRNHLEDEINTYLMRYIKMFMNVFNIEEGLLISNGYKTKNFNIFITHYDYVELQKLIKDKELSVKKKLIIFEKLLNNISFKKINTDESSILTSLTDKINIFYNFVITKLDFMYSYDSLYLLSMIFTIIFYHTVSKHLFYVIIFLINNIISIDVFKCYWNQRHYKTMEKYHTLSRLQNTECNDENISWLRQMYRDTFGDPCKQYIQYSGDVQVSLPDCILQTYSNYLLVSPLKFIGSGVAEFNKQVTGLFPFPMNYIVNCLSLSIIISILVSVVMSLLFGYDIHINSILSSFVLKAGRRGSRGRSEEREEVLVQRVEELTKVKQASGVQSQVVPTQINNYYMMSASETNMFSRQQSFTADRPGDDRRSSQESLNNSDRDSNPGLRSRRSLTGSKRQQLMERIEEWFDEQEAKDEEKEQVNVVDSVKSIADRVSEDGNEFKSCVEQLNVILEQFKLEMASERVTADTECNRQQLQTKNV